MNDNNPTDQPGNDDRLIDAEISSQLRNRSEGVTIDVAAAHHDVLRQAGQIRRRRSAVMTVGTTAVLIAGSWALIAARGGDGSVGLAAPGPTTTVSVSTTTGDTVVTSPTTKISTSNSNVLTTDVRVGDGDGDDDDRSTTGSVAGTDDDTNTTTGNTTGNTTNNTTGNTTGNTVDDHGGDDDDDATSTSTANTTVNTTGSTTTATSGPAPFTNTYNSAGGSITVSWNGSSLSLGSVSPAAGFSSEIEDQRSDRVRVRFGSDNGDSRIEVRIEGSNVEVRID